MDKIKLPKTSQEYLYLVKRFLKEANYKDVLSGIRDSDHYATLELQYQRIVDNYYSYQF